MEVIIITERKRVFGFEYPVTAYHLDIKKSDDILCVPVNNGKAEMRQLGVGENDYACFLYRTVGERWHWAVRHFWDLEQWNQRLSKSNVFIWVLESDGKPMGYYELEEQQDKNVEIMYLGLISDSIGKGFGSFILTDALQRSFSMGALRVHVWTCTLDHPRALPNYQALGMKLLKTEKQIKHFPPGWPRPELDKAGTL